MSSDEYFGLWVSQLPLNMVFLNPRGWWNFPWLNQVVAVPGLLSCGLPSYGRKWAICTNLCAIDLWKCLFLVQPWSVLVTRAIFWPWLFTESSHASPEYGDLKTQRFGNPFLTLSNITVSGLLWCGFPCSEEVARFAPMCAGLSFEKNFLVHTWLSICHPEQYGIF